MSVGARKCRFCKAYAKIADGVVLNGGFYCCQDHVVQYAIQNRDKGKKIADKAHKQRKREFYADDVQTRREAAVLWFNRFIRLRDQDLPCISCGTTKPDIQYHAGHFKTTHVTSLRFDEQNVNKQCSRCNNYLSGNLAEYRKGLVAKYGQEVLDRLEGPQPTIKITAAWYQSIEDTYKAKCKELQDAQK